jgi:uncharacterized membrane protein YgcG
MIKPSLALATLATSFTLGACAGLHDPTADDAVAAMDQAYAKLGELTSTTTPVAVHTHVLQSGSVADIADQRYTDLVTYYPSAQTALDTALQTTPGGNPTRAYTVSWTTPEAAAGDVPAYTLDDVWNLAQGTPSSSTADAVPLDGAGSFVRYHVDLTLAGKSVSYDALLVVENGEPIVFDPVLWMMNSVLREEVNGTAPVEAVDDQVAESGAGSAGLGSGGGGSGGGSGGGGGGGGGGSGGGSGAMACTASSWTNPGAIVNSQVASDYHVSGNHRAFSSSNYSCSCDTTCMSTCTPLGSSYATDTGTYIAQPGLGWWHTTSSARNNIPGTAQPGAGASCDSAGGALVKNCLLGAICDIQIGFTVGGAGVAVTIPTGVYPASIYVQAKSAIRGTCAPCQPTPVATAPNPAP